jgi:hypothetical protein
MQRLSAGNFKPAIFNLKLWFLNPWLLGPFLFFDPQEHPPNKGHEQGAADQDDETGREERSQEYARVVDLIGADHLLDPKLQKKDGHCRKENETDPPEHFRLLFSPFP